VTKVGHGERIKHAQRPRPVARNRLDKNEDPDGRKPLGQPNAPKPAFAPKRPPPGSVKADPVALAALKLKPLPKVMLAPQGPVSKVVKRLADGRMLTIPLLPPKIVGEHEGVRIEHRYRSNDHPPAHVHVLGGGPPTAVGMNGRPVLNHPEPTDAQRKVIEMYKREVRRSVRKIGRWLWFQEQ
jgi:hypothetical protein